MTVAFCRRVGRALAFGIIVTGSSAHAQTWDWTTAFPQPLFLVKCTEAVCPHDGLSLVADLAVVGHAFRVLGGPYELRVAVEEDRNRLAASNDLPEYSVLVQMFGSGATQIGSFWLGAKPVCAYSDQVLTDDVLADFGLGGSRPEHFPLPFDQQDYLDAIAELRQECGGDE